MADAQQSSGFTLPPPPQAAPEQPTTPSGQAPTAPLTPSLGFTVPPPTEAEGPQTRDYFIGGGILLVLVVAFFFAKKAYANHLVSKRVSIPKADAAGWWLFIFLTTLATTSTLAVVNSDKFLSLVFLAPMLVVSLTAIVFTLLCSRR